MLKFIKFSKENKNRGWVTSIMEHPIKINQMFINIIKNWNLFSISEGVIHCYADLFTVKENFEALNDLYPGHAYGLFIGVIPRGHKYIIGKNNEVGVSAIIVKDLLYFCQNGEIMKTK